MSVSGFDALRSDTYEKHIAARSLTELEGLYRTLLAPSGSYEEKQKLCPVWRKGGQGEDKLPDITTLSRIKHRIRAGQMVDDVDEKMERLRVMVERLAGVSISKKTAILDAMLALMGAELWDAKLEGKPVTENLPVVDRVIKAVAAKARVEQGDTRNRQMEKIQNGRLELEQKKFEFQVKQATPEPVPVPVKKELPPYDPDVEEAKIER